MNHFGGTRPVLAMPNYSPGHIDLRSVVEDMNPYALYRGEDVAQLLKELAGGSRSPSGTCHVEPQGSYCRHCGSALRVGGWGGWPGESGGVSHPTW